MCLKRDVGLFLFFLAFFGVKSFFFFCFFVFFVSSKVGLSGIGIPSGRIPVNGYEKFGFSSFFLPQGAM